AETFNLYFSSYFDLFPTDVLIEQGVFGPVSDTARKFLGDFIAIAKHKYAFSVKDDPHFFKATHAGGLKEEMIVPVIAVKNSRR
nr:hypothetical protein [Bacilli bacterium]